MARLAFRSFKGLLPVIDPKQVNEPFVINGQNFFVDAVGPISAFGGTINIPRAITNPLIQNISSFVIGNQTFIFLSEGVFCVDYTSKILIPKLIFSSIFSLQNLPDFPWSHATIGGKDYFVRKGLTTVIQYDQITEQWVEISTDVPTNPIAVTQSAGRLIIVAESVVAWSAIDDGEDLSPSTVTGAGFQVLSIIGKGETLGVLETVDGFLTYTTAGIMKSKIISSVLPFTHRTLSTKHKAINPFSIIEVGERQHIFLTRTGFFSTTGEIPQPWQPLFSEFFHQTLLPTIDLSVPSTIRLFYDIDRQWLFVSISSAAQPRLYTRSFVYYLPTDQWGSFNRNHISFIRLNRDPITSIGFDFSFVDTIGNIKTITSNSFIEELPILNFKHYFYRIKYALSARRSANINYMPSIGFFSPIDESIFQPINITNYYNLRFELETLIEPINQLSTELSSVFDSGIGGYRMKIVFQGSSGLLHTQVKQAEKNNQSLNSFIIIGPFRITKNESANELGFLSEIVIGTLEKESDEEIDDLMLDYEEEVVEDLELFSEVIEDLGFFTISSANFDLETIPTLDASYLNEYDDGNLNQKAELILEDGTQRFYSTSRTGLFHLLKLNGTAENNFFHLKTLETTMISAGKIH